MSKYVIGLTWSRHLIAGRGSILTYIVGEIYRELTMSACILDETEIVLCYYLKPLVYRVE